MKGRGGGLRGEGEGGRGDLIIDLVFIQCNIGR